MDEQSHAVLNSISFDFLNYLVAQDRLPVLGFSVDLNTRHPNTGIILILALFSYLIGYVVHYLYDDATFLELR